MPWVAYRGGGGGGGGKLVMLFICWFEFGAPIGGGGGGTWKGLEGSLAETCLWLAGNMLGGAGGNPPRGID